MCELLYVLVRCVDDGDKLCPHALFVIVNGAVLAGVIVHVLLWVPLLLFFIWLDRFHNSWDILLERILHWGLCFRL